jgi:hypothetical protein
MDLSTKKARARSVEFKRLRGSQPSGVSEREPNAEGCTCPGKLNRIG